MALLTIKMTKIREFFLPKAKLTASVEVLDLSHMAQVLAVQDETRTALLPAEKRFVIPQTPAYFQRLLSQENGMMIGIRCNGQLIAQMAVMGAMSLPDALENDSITRNNVRLHHAEPSDMIVIAKSMAVLPTWRGNELSQHLLESALSLPFVRSADHMFAQISANNVRSWDVFLKQGFGIVAAAIDPIDNQPRFILQKPALGFALHPVASAVDIAPSTDFEAVVRLTEREALVGQVDSTEPTRLTFYASADNASTWSEDIVGRRAHI
jgi:GNAT superfamily N-acetyltransferase